jgi:hypothetical protein
MKLIVDLKIDNNSTICEHDKLPFDDASLNDKKWYAKNSL